MLAMQIALKVDSKQNTCVNVHDKMRYEVGTKKKDEVCRCQHVEQLAVGSARPR